MDINPKDETSYTTLYHVALLKYVENEHCAKHRHLLVTKPKTITNDNLVSSAMASRSGQSSYDTYDLSSDDEEFLLANNVAETTPGRSDSAAYSLTPSRLVLHSAPELRQNWGQVNPNHNHYHSDVNENSSTFWLPDITDWWQEQEATHSK